MSRIEELNKQIEELKEKIDSLVQELGPLIEEKEELEAQERLESLSLTRDDVQLGAAPGVSFRTAGDLLDWMKQKSNPRKYFEWNGKVYPVENGMESIMRRKHICDYDDVPEDSDAVMEKG